MKDFDYQHWLTTARRFTRRKDEAADLLHDALLDAVRAQRIDFSQQKNRAWFNGVLRNRAAMTARSAARRKHRESIERPRSETPSVDELEPSFLEHLPAAARRVATLIVAGMSKTEITTALNLTDTAFRQRLTSIRRAWRAIGSEAMPAVRGDSRNDIGLIRQALLHHLKWNARDAVGTHDPDGHLIVFESSKKSSSQKPARRQR